MRVSASSATDGKIYVYRGVDGSGKATHSSGSVVKVVDPNVAFLLGLVSPKESYTEGQVLVSTGRYITGSDGLTPGGGVSTVKAQGSGWIHMNASPTLAQTPYIDLFERTGSDIYDAQMKLRLGDLSGLHGTRLGNEVAIDRESGFGLASENVYLSGLIKASSGSIGGIIMEDNKLFTGTGTHGNTNTGFFIDSASNFSLGDRVVWDGENKTLSVTGSAVTFETPKFFFGESGTSISGSNGNILISGSAVDVRTKTFYLGNASTYLSGSNGSLEIKSEEFDLGSSTVSMSSADSGKIMMGTNIPSASGQDGIWLSGSGHFSFQSSSAAYIRSTQDGFAMNFPSFSVDTAGRMSATDGTFKGHLEAQTGFFGRSVWDEKFEIYFELGSLKITLPPQHDIKSNATFILEKWNNKYKKIVYNKKHKWSFYYQSRDFIESLMNKRKINLNSGKDALNDMIIVEDIWKKFIETTNVRK